MTSKELGAASAYPRNDNSGGLTKREYFAALAMQGLIAWPAREVATHSRMAEESVACADALLAELAKETQS